MGRRIFLTVLWLGFIAYAFWGAPPQQPDTLELILKLSSGEWEGINPAVVALFNAMGIWPLVYACLALVDGHNQRVPAWPFVVGSLGLGAFLLLPYLILRQPNPGFSGTQSRLLKTVESRWLGGLLLVGAVGLMAYGIGAGSWADFIEQWRHSRFIHVMGLDFCLLWLLLPTLLGDDMTKRGLDSTTVLGLTALVPLVGPAAYLMLRPPLQMEPKSETASAGKTNTAAGIR